MQSIRLKFLRSVWFGFSSRVSGGLAKVSLGAVFLGLFLVVGCKNVTDPHDHNEGELITTVRLDLVNTDDASETVSATIKFKEGFGHDEALERNDTLKLKAGIEYAATITLLNESVSPAEDMTTEIAEEAGEHQLFYQPSASALTIAYADEDDAGLPIGIETIMTAANTGSLNLKVTLKHQPDLKNSTSTVATGETDVEVNFAVRISE
jgi:hypothetical protein